MSKQLTIDNIVEQPHKLAIVYQSPELCMKVILQNVKAIRFVHPDFKSVDLCLEAVKRWNTALKYVRKDFPKDTMEEIIHTSVKTDGYSIRFVPKQYITDALLKLALKTDGSVIRYIDNQSEEMCLDAIKILPKAIKYVKEPTYEMCYAAIKKDGNALIDIPQDMYTTVMVRMAIKNAPSIIRILPERFRTEAYYLFAVKCDGLALNYVPEKFRTAEVVEEAIKQNGLSIANLTDPSYQLKMDAIKQTGLALKYMSKGQTKELALEAVKQNPDAIQFVRKEFMKCCLDEVRKEEVDEPIITTNSDLEKGLKYITVISDKGKVVKQCIDKPIFDYICDKYKSISIIENVDNIKNNGIYVLELDEFTVEVYEMKTVRKTNQGWFWVTEDEEQELVKLETYHITPYGLATDKVFGF